MVCVEVDARAVGGGLESGASDETTARGVIAIARKHGVGSGTDIAAVEGDCEDFLVERACPIEIGSRNFEPVDGFVRAARMAGCC